MFYTTLVAFICCFTSLQAADALYLTWQNDPTTTMTIQWLTDPKSVSDELEVRKSSDNQTWQKVTGTHKALPYDAPYIVHTVEVTGLTPDCQYTFHLPEDKEEHLFKTMPSDLSKPIQFVTGGDACHDSGTLFEEMAIKVASTGPRFVLLGGDIAYSVSDKRRAYDKLDRWMSFLKTWTKTMKAPDGCIIPLVPAIGNHEVMGYYGQTPDQAKFFYTLFATPGVEGRKLLCFGKYMAICILDSNHTHPIGGEQTAWLKEALRKSYAYTHRFAVYHVPAYPSVRYYGMRESASIRRNWVPLFERYRTNAVFENHEHAYKRTHPLIDGSEHPDGVVYFGDGSWGVKPRIPKSTFRTTYLAKSACTRQFLQIELTNTTRTFKAITPTGEVIDTYSQKVEPL
ncbi:MAG: metallophosphoesterase family protein [Chlamydiales bacterium]|nr:metallophosphoesterase family protein [Chlamydiales bacterium]